jgi:hypothetical protein
MNRNFIYILLLIWLVANGPVAYGQETRLTGTLKMHPWVTLPVVVSSDIKGGMQSLGTLDLTTPATILNTTIPTTKRDLGMIVSTIDNVSNQPRFFEYTATDTWREVYVTQSWEAGHVYSIGDFVAYNGNYYIANAAFTSSALFVTDVNWNRAGGKDAVYDVSKLYLNGNFVSKVAKGGDVVTTALLDSTLVTAGYVSQATSNSSFSGTKAITRPGWVGITGFNPNTGTVADFLNKVFYPVSSPLVTSFNYNGVVNSGQYSYETADAQKVVTDNLGTVPINYSVWSAATNLTFNYIVNNRSVADGDNKKITKVELYNGVTSLGNNAIGTITTPLSGSFLVPKTSLTTNVDGNSPNVLTLRVTDEASNVVNLNLTTTLNQALGVTVSNAHITTTVGGSAITTSEGGGTLSNPYLIERTGAALPYFLEWNLTSNDDVGKITNIYFTGTAEKPATDLNGTALTNTSAAITIPNSDFTVCQLSVAAKGSVANDLSAVSTTYGYQLMDRFYCGYLPSDIAPTEAQIKALPTNSLNTSAYYNDAGASYTNGTAGSSSGFFTWAVPTYVDGSLAAPTFSKTAYYQAAGSWNVNSNINTYYVRVTPPGGGATSWYWVCIYKASIAGAGATIAKLY